MRVLLNPTMIQAWKIEVYNVADIANVNTTSRDASGNHNWHSSFAERAHGILALKLSAISVKRGARQAPVEKEVVKLIRGALVVDKDQGARRRHRIEQVQHGLTLHRRISLHNGLNDVLVGSASTANTETNVLSGQVSHCELTHTLGEGRREKQVLNVALFLLCVTSQ